MADKTSEQQRTSPDAYSRHYIVAEIIRQVFSNKKIDLLDVGGAGTYVDYFRGSSSPVKTVTVIDILPPPDKIEGITYIQGDATKMTFVDNQFDAVVSTDVFEHISDKTKDKFITECLRVAKDLVVVGAPFESEEVTHAETLANDYYKKITGKPHLWLNEHFELNKPKAENVEAILAKGKYKYLKFSSNQIDSWLQSILINFMKETNVLERPLVEQFNQFYNSHLDQMGDFRPPGYRSFYVVFKNKALARGLDQLLPSAGGALAKLDLEAMFLTRLADDRKQLTDQKNNLEETANQNQVLTEQIEAVTVQLKEKTEIVKELDAEISGLRSRRWYGLYTLLGGGRK